MVYWYALCKHCFCYCNIDMLHVTRVCHCSLVDECMTDIRLLWLFCNNQRLFQATCRVLSVTIYSVSQKVFREIF